MSTYDEKILEKIEAICKLASSNFPANTDVTISVKGTGNGTVTVPSYVMLQMLEQARKVAEVKRLADAGN